MTNKREYQFISPDFDLHPAAGGQAVIFRDVAGVDLMFVGMVLNPDCEQLLALSEVYKALRAGYLAILNNQLRGATLELDKVNTENFYRIVIEGGVGVGSPTFSFIYGPHQLRVLLEVLTEPLTPETYWVKYSVCRKEENPYKLFDSMPHTAFRRAEVVQALAELRDRAYDLTELIYNELDVPEEERDVR